jgi:EAL domain-containing protein (putative c-di-GMP-specific phosphodiesterase class I)
LLRLQLPAQGLVGPQHYIELAEETGLIVPLGRWVLQTAAEQLAAWALIPERALLSIAVNVSARQFRAADFVPGLQALLAGGRFAPECLKLELTESLLLDEVDTAIATMQRVAALGLRFSLDDFGTGYSSLNYLKRLPLQQLKIDKSFVDDLGESPDGAAIAQMIVALGDSLGLEVIAEGVEQAAQRDALLRLGCRRFQGYLFGRPMPVEALEALLSPAPGPGSSGSSGQTGA